MIRFNGPQFTPYRALFFLTFFAAQCFGSISGKLVDSNGSPIDSAKISVQFNHIVAHSNSSGSFFIRTISEITNSPPSIETFQNYTLYNSLGFKIQEGNQNLFQTLRRLQPGVFFIRIVTSQGTTHYKYLNLSKNSPQINFIKPLLSSTSEYLKIEKQGYLDTIISLNKNPKNLGTIQLTQTIPSPPKIFKGFMFLTD